jgi:predicted dehydrogenase
MKFGVIGTNLITERTLGSARQCSDFSLAAVCSRSKERAEQFARQQDAPFAFDSVDDLAACGDVEAVYIAVPNAFHCAYAVKMLNSGKHVLCEKPFASNSKEAKRMFEAADKNDRLILESMRPLFSPAYPEIQAGLARLGTPRRVSFVYNQYSSRYDNFKKGIIENAFKPELSNGALMDLGVYCTAMLVALFGVPQAVDARAVRLAGSIDGQGIIVACYDTMLAELSYSKISQAVLPSVIQGEDGSMIIDSLGAIRSIRLEMRNGETAGLFCQDEEYDGVYVIEKFINLIKSGDKALSFRRITLETMNILDEARGQQGIVFPADQA